MNILRALLSIIITIILIPIQIIFWIFLFLKANFGRNRIPDDIRDSNFKDGVVSFTTSDDLSIEDTKQLYKELGDEFQFPEQIDTVEHVYTLQFVEGKEHCPRCDSKTEQRLANFIYDTEFEIRIMYTPAGYYCLKCPTAIIDLDLIKKGVARNYKFNKLLGIENDEGINFLQSYNGEDMVYSTEDLATIFSADFTDAIVKCKGNKTKTQKRKKKKLQKTARKKSRPKK